MTDAEPIAARAAGRRRSIVMFGPVLLVIIAAIGAVVWWPAGPDDPVAEPVSIVADGPRFATLEELVAASDLVVRATVTRVDEGRRITDPADPNSGIRTQLAAVTVDDVLVGTQDGTLLVEQEAALLDRTPVRVNGVDPLRVGDRGLMFLVRGTSDEFPYTALVNEQGWLPIVADRLAPLDPDDPVWTDVGGRSVEQLLVLFD